MPLLSWRVPQRARCVLPFGAAAGAAVVVLAGCGQPVQAGSAALVGDRKIGVDHLQRISSRVLATQAGQQQFGNDVAGLQRTVLSRMIDTLLLHQAALSLHVTVDQGEVNARLDALDSQAGGRDALVQQAISGGITPAELPAAVSDITLQDALGAKLVEDVPVSRQELEQAYQQNIDTYDQVHAAHILVKSKALAQQLLTEVRAHPDRFAALAKQYSLDQQSGANGGDLGLNGKGAFVPAFGNPVFAAKPGSFILVHTQFGWHVVHVISRETRSLAQVASQLRQSLLQSQINTRLSAIFQATARRLGVTVNPRYGVWDPKNEVVVPAPDDLSKPAHSPTPEPSSPGLPLPGG